MKLLSWNVNGIRAATRKGFLAWFKSQGADIVSLQETRARPEQLTESLLHPQGFHSYWHTAEKPGYSGVAIYSRTKPRTVHHGIKYPEIDREGRVIHAEFADFNLVNAYFPHARHDLTRLDYKLLFCDRLLDLLETLAANGKPIILCGDYNISHQEIDLANPRANRHNPGFLPVERAWMDRFLAKGYRDVFRDLHPGESGHYSWWSYRKGVRERNVGWRIDYICVSESLCGRVTAAGHQPEVMGSDHCPVFLELA